MNYLIKILLLALIIPFSVSANIIDNNKIIFEINNKIYTNVDFEKRVNYIKIINNLKDNEIKDIDRKNILEDYISSQIFNEYNIKYQLIEANLEKEINNFYKNNILNKQNSLSLEDVNNNIKDNIKIDLIRKKIIENFLNSKRKILLKKTESLDLIYNYSLEYLIVDVKNINLKLVNKIFTKKDFYNYKKKLTMGKIDFLSKKAEIYNILKVSQDIKEMILQNENIKIINTKKFIKIISIEKELSSYDGIYVKLINFKSKNKIKENKLNCKSINNITDHNTFKEYEYSKLNKQIQNNLKSVNDYIIYSNEDIYTYIFLCELRYDEKILNTVDFNKKVKNLAENIQFKFINKYKNEFNFKEYND